MSGFENARRVETEAMHRLLPFLEERSDGRLVLIEKGPLAAELQQTVGDVLYNRAYGDRRLVSVEVKAEVRHTGNLFLEAWSNINVADANSWEARGPNVGWLAKIHPTLLFFYFLDVDRLYIVKAFDLFRWAYSTPSLRGGAGASRIHDFHLAPQRKHVQLNDTRGHLVPVEVIQAEVGFHLVHPMQLAMWPEWPGDAA